MAGRPGATKVVSGPERVPGLRGALGWVGDSEPIELALVAESVVDGIAVTGRISGRMLLSCSRCLVAYDELFEGQIDEVFYFEEGEEKGGYEVKGRTIDLEPVVRDSIVLAIPTHPLHRDDCKGLCATCGSDLNVVDCGHRLDEVGLRFLPLAEFLKTKEV
ncbi:MAG: YceD family protein [Actinomycetota bacterium]